MDKIFISNCLILLVIIIILLVYYKFVILNNPNSEKFSNTVKFGFFGNHKNIYQNGMNRYI